MEGGFSFKPVKLHTCDNAKSATGLLHAGFSGKFGTTQKQEGDGQEEEDADQGCRGAQTAEKEEDCV